MRDGRIVDDTTLTSAPDPSRLLSSLIQLEV